MRKLLCLLLLLFASPAWAADIGCGVDTDLSAGANSGASDNPCPEPDKDNDKYPSSDSHTGPYGSAIDCDDTNWWIKPGVETASGCSAGQYRTCQADGTYTACSNISAFTCHTGSGKTVWFGPSGSTSGGCGTAYGSPCSWLCLSNSSLGCYDPSDAGDCNVYQPGSYSGTYSDGGTTRQLYINNRDGTEANPIIFRGEPGAIPGYSNAAILNGAGTSPNEVFLVYVFSSNYVQFKFLEIDGTSDYSNSGIHFDGGVSQVSKWNYIHNVGGESNNNLSGVKCRTTSGCYINENLFEENCEVGDCSNQNSCHVTVMDDTGTTEVNDNFGWSSNTMGCAYRIKHATDTTTPTLSRNFAKNVSQYAIGSENKDTTVKNNWIQDCDAYAFRYAGIGSVSGWWKNSVFSYNTVQRCATLTASPDWDDSTSHQSYKSGTTIFTAERNIMEDDNASYDGDAGDGVTRMCEYNCTSGEFAAASGKAIWQDNVYYSSGTSTLRFGYFGQAGGGADYSSLASWQGAGFDSGSVQDDPALDADGLSAEYPDHGWRAGMFEATGEPTPTPTPTPDPASIGKTTGRMRIR